MANAPARFVGGSNKVKNSAIIVDVTAAQILVTPLEGRVRVELANLGSHVVYIGYDATVTAANGFPIPLTTGRLTLDVDATFQLWAITSTAIQVSPACLRALEVA